MPRKPRFISACAVALCVAALPAGALAQRALHWDNVEVAAHLDAEGRLLVTETQAMAFSGDWNGGERRFNSRRLHQFAFRNWWAPVVWFSQRLRR